MKFVTEKNKDESHRVTIDIPKEIINNSIQKEFIKISKTKIINGFRKGKIPITFVQNKYGDAVYYDIFKQLMQKFFYEFINKEQIKIIDTPKYYIHKNNNAKDLYVKYSVIYNIYPKFKIKNIKNLTVDQINVKITDEDIKNNIEKYKYKNFFWKTVNKPIKSHHRVTINYEVYNHTNLINEFNKKNFTFIVSDNTLIPQLKYKIINHFINDIVFFTIKFHLLYPIKKLQNQNITFKIKIINIEEQEEKEIDSKIIKNISEKQLNQKNYINIKQKIVQQIQQITEKYLEDQIINKIIEKKIILIPPSLFEKYKNNLYAEYVKQYQEKNSNILEKKYHYNIDTQVKKTLCMQIILENIISDEKIFLDEKNIISLIKKISLNYKNPIKIINLYHKNETFKNTIKNIELKNQAIKILKNNINIVKKYWTFNDFVNYKWDIHNELTI